MSARDFLLEIGLEELPARFAAGLSAALREGLEEECRSAGLPFDGSEAWVTPRRLAVRLSGLPEAQPEREETVLGPPAKVAFDAGGNPTRAAEGFAKSHGVGPEELRPVKTEKGEYAGLVRKAGGLPTAELLGEAVRRVVEALPCPITMHWGEGSGPFVRAVRWVVAMLGGEVVPLELHGVSAGAETRGHRVLGPGPLPVAGAADYLEVLRGAGVEPDPARRIETIRRGLAEGAVALGGEAIDDEELLHRVAHLVEHPVVAAGRFDPRYLTLPEEVLITAMRGHQNLFAVRGPEGRLEAGFLGVLNADDPEGTVVAGVERVLRARLEDARFFFKQDMRTRLGEDHMETAHRAVFHRDLGTYGDKVRRLVSRIEEEQDDLREAAGLAKADLATAMVGEFPELQGRMGGIYLREEARPEEVWRAVYDHYLPAGADDPLPATQSGRALALLDKTDTLVGCLGVGVKVSGSKDPFGLRRAALGVVRILAEGESAPLPSRLSKLLRQAAESLSGVKGFQEERAVEGATRLAENRFRYLLEQRGYPYDEINAVLAAGWDRVRSAVGRTEALHAVRAEGEIEGLSVPFKRARNIIRQAREEGLETWEEAREELLREDGERELFQLAREVRESTKPHLAHGRYGEALREMTGLRAAVDRFFEEILVMAEDEEVRSNRIGLLVEIEALFLRVADIGEIVIAGES
jgi:glycyl-tRNA synthetase beta chain